MRLFRFIPALLALTMTACSPEEISSIIEEPTPQDRPLSGIVMRLPDFSIDHLTDTRTSLTPTSLGIDFRWTSKDVVGIYSTDRTMASFHIEDISADAKAATFTGGGFELNSGDTYYAFNPFDGNKTSLTGVPVKYTGQSQNGNGSTSHLAAYDYMSASTTATGNNQAVFDFSHIGAIMRFDITVPADATFKEAEFTSSGNKFVSQGTVDLSAGPVITAISQSSSLCVALNNLTATAQSDVVIYAFTAPVDLSTGCIKLKLTSTDNIEYTGAVYGKNMLRGNAYAYSIEAEKPTPYVTFSSTDDTQAFILTQKGNWPIDVVIEYSVDGNVWTKVPFGQEIPFGGDNGDIRLRAQNSFGTALDTETYLQISFKQDTEVACTGDIRTLVDYEDYENADCSNARFINLFNGCTQLTSAPDLPSTTLADHCYDSMFKGCSNLSSPILLPAKDLAEGCYNSMFEGCTILTYVEAAFTTSLTDENGEFIYTKDWLKGVSDNGTIKIDVNAPWYNSGSMDYGDSSIPVGWKVSFNGNYGIGSDLPGDSDW